MTKDELIFEIGAATIEMRRVYLLCKKGDAPLAIWSKLVEHRESLWKKWDELNGESNPVVTPFPPTPPKQ